MPPTPSSPARRVARAALGAFVVAQLLFLLTSNAVNLLRAYAPGWRRARLVATAAAVTDRWAELTGQHQDWALFAPSVGRDVVFPAVEFRWHDGVTPAVLILSDNEPTDRGSFFRLGRFRLRRYETKFDMALPEPGAVALENLDGWNRDLDDLARGEWRRCHAYLRWRLTRFLREHDSVDPPDEAVLLLRRYRVPSADRTPWDWDGPDTFPVARLLPGRDLGPESLPVERYNPVAERFEPMRRGR